MDPGKELARLRTEKGLTLKALAELAGTTQDYIWDLEHGKLPGIKVASNLAKVLGVPLDVFWIKYKQKSDMVEDLEKICQLAESPGIEMLDLSPRSFNALYGANVETVDELLKLSEEELLKIRRLGPASRREVKLKLIQYSLHRTNMALKIGIIEGF